jgi:hypothetical protein
LTGFNSGFFDDASFVKFLDQTNKSHANDEESYLQLDGDLAKYYDKKKFQQKNFSSQVFRNECEALT